MELDECVFLHLVRRYFRFIRSLSFVERQDRRLDRPPFHRRNRGYYSSSASHHYQMFFLSLDYSLFFLRTCVYIHTYTQLVYAYTHRFFIYPSLTRSFALSPTNGPPHSSSVSWFLPFRPGFLHRSPLLQGLLSSSQQNETLWVHSDLSIVRHTRSYTQRNAMHSTDRPTDRSGLETCALLSSRSNRNPSPTFVHTVH